MPNPTPPTSPYVLYQTSDFAGSIISITITFDASQNLTGASVFRDPACVYTHVYIGLGSDGSVENTAKKFTVPSGTTNVTTKQLNSVGLNTFSDVVGIQITAGP